MTRTIPSPYLHDHHALDKLSPGNKMAPATPVRDITFETLYLEHECPGRSAGHEDLGGRRLASTPSRSHGFF